MAKSEKQLTSSGRFLQINALEYRLITIPWHYIYKCSAFGEKVDAVPEIYVRLTNDVTELLSLSQPHMFVVNSQR